MQWSDVWEKAIARCGAVSLKEVLWSLFHCGEDGCEIALGLETTLTQGKIFLLFPDIVFESASLVRRQERILRNTSPSFGDLSGELSLVATRIHGGGDRRRRTFDSGEEPGTPMIRNFGSVVGVKVRIGQQPPVFTLAVSSPIAHGL